MSRARPPFNPAKLLETLQTWPEPESYCVALSGGADSTALLLALSQSDPKLPLRALHINHGLHPDADSWARHCVALCESIDIAVEVETVEVEQAGSGIETAARKARRGVYLNHLQHNEALLTGQHADDQAETLLLQALRGSGVDGLAGMREIQAFGPGFMARPMLGWTHAELKNWLNQQGVNWIEDSSNRDTDIPRNFLRHQVLPLLETHWPQPQLRLARSATLSRRVSDWQQAWADALLSDHSTVLPWAVLAGREAIQQQTLIRQWLRKRGACVPNQARLHEALRQFHTARQDAEILIEWPGSELRLWQQQLYVHSPLQPHSDQWPIAWQQATQTLPDQLGTLQLLNKTGDEPDTDLLLDLKLTIDYRRGGERLQRGPDQPSQQLKHWFQEQAVPPWLRSRMPLLQQQGQIVAVGDRWLSEPFQQTLATGDLHLKWQPDPIYMACSA